MSMATKMPMARGSLVFLGASGGSKASVRQVWLFHTPGSLFSNLACYSVRGLLFNVVNMPAASLWVNKRMCVLTSVNVGMCVCHN